MLLVAARKPALRGKFIGLSKRAKQTIPPCDISIVEAVNIKLMMDRMMLRPLDKVTQPMGRAEIAVVEILP